MMLSQIRIEHLIHEDKQTPKRTKNHVTIDFDGLSELEKA